MSNVVYCLTCDCGAKYVGQTSQFLSKRIQQHQASLRRLRTDKLQSSENTGVTQHISENPEHNILFDDVKIIEKESKYPKRLFKEAVHIRKTRQTMNLQKDTMDHVVSTLYSVCSVPMNVVHCITYRLRCLRLHSSIPDRWCF